MAVARRNRSRRKARAGGLPLTASLGVVGWERLDPVLLAALATEAPLLLVGAHGTAKTLVAERVAAALGLEFRHYNASLLNYDDLVGIPMPDESGERAPVRRHAGDGLGGRVRASRRDLPLPARPAEQAVPDRARAEGRRRAAAAAAAPVGGDEPAARRTTTTCSRTSRRISARSRSTPALADRFPFVVRVPGWDELDAAERALARARRRHAGERRPAGPRERVPPSGGRRSSRPLGARVADYAVAVVDQLRGAEDAR